MESVLKQTVQREMRATEPQTEGSGQKAKGWTTMLSLSQIFKTV